MPPDPNWLAEFLQRERLAGDDFETILTTFSPLAKDILARTTTGPSPFVVGLCGPQGSGKSTGAEVLAHLLERRGLTCAILALDDLYLPKAERVRLAAEVHPLLATRGPPGTHDPALALELLDRLGRAGPVTLPAFDKGADDRRATGRVVHGPVQVVIFEGWCVGARPQDADALARSINALERDEDPDGRWRGFVNARLAGPYRPLFARIDRLVMLKGPGFETVLDWRLEQERKLRAAQGEGAGMSDAAVARFVAHYERLTRHIDAEMPSRADVVVRLDARRRPAPAF